MTTTRKPTMRDVARATNVSVATVSYALRGEASGMTPATARRIREAAAELGYVPNAAATALARGHSRIVLVAHDETFVGDVTERSNHELVGIFENLGYRALFYEVSSEDDLVATAHAIQPAAVFHLAFLTASTLRRLRAAGVPRLFGFTAGGDPTDSGVPERAWERELGSAQAGFLHARGYRRLAYVIPESSPRRPVALSRLAGFTARCDALGVSAPEVVTAPIDVAAIAESLRMLPKADIWAVAAFDDRTAIGVMGAAWELGWRVPDRIAVIGCDDTVEASLIRPALTSVSLRTTPVPVWAEWLKAEMGGDEGRAREMRAHVTPETTVHARQTA